MSRIGLIRWSGCHSKDCTNSSYRFANEPGNAEPDGQDDGRQYGKACDAFHYVDEWISRSLTSLSEYREPEGHEHSGCCQNRRRYR